MLANLENSAVATGQKKLFLFQSQRKVKLKNVQTTTQLHSSHTPVGHNWATSLSLFTFHFHALEKEMATHSSILAWRIPGMAEPGGLLSMGSHRIRHDWSDLAAAAHTNKVMLKILQARLQQYVNYELPYIQAGFRKGRGNQRSNCQHSLDHQKSERVPEKHLFLLCWLCQSLWLCGSQ